MLKNLWVYTNASLSMVKHSDHITHSVYLKIRRISHILTRKNTDQLLCSFVISHSDFLLIDINCDQMSRLKKFETTQQKQT